MDSLEGLLREHTFFFGLDSDYFELITGCASNVRFNAGKEIFREDTEANQFYLIRTGKVALEIHLPQRGSLVIDTLGEGEVLGFSWLFPPYRWVFDARAVEDVRAIAIEGTCLRKKCDEDPRLGYELVKRFSATMSERLFAARSRLIDMYGNSTGVETAS